MEPYEYVTVISTPLVVVFGLVGNAMTAAVLTRKRFRSRNISVYLMALAVVDSVFLLSNTMVSLTIFYLGGPDIQGLSDAGCKLAKYVIMSSRAISAWLVVVLTVQRLLAMSIPHLASVLSTRRQAYISTGVVMGFVMALYSYLFFVIELTPTYGQCMWSQHVVYQVRTLLNIADLLFYSLIPAVILATCNSILVYMLFYSEELRKEATKSQCTRGAGGAGGGASGGSDSRSITVILVLMSVCFIVLTLPMTLYQVVYTVGFRPHQPLIYPTLYLLDLINHAVNFLLYCVSGPSFRAEIKDMCTCKDARARWHRNRKYLHGGSSGGSKSNTYRRRYRKSGDTTQSTQETRVNGLGNTSAPSSPSVTDYKPLYPKLPECV